MSSTECITKNALQQRNFLAVHFGSTTETGSKLLTRLSLGGIVTSLRLREMMRRSLRAAGLGRHESGPSSSDHQDPVSPPIAPPSWVPDPPPMDPGECI